MYPTTNIQPGQTGSEVKKLQDFLVSQGYMTQQQVNTGYGTYGPQTTAAVKKFQAASGVNNASGPGYWGPQTISAARGGSSPSNNGRPSDEGYQSKLDTHPLNPGNSAAELEYAYLTGDLSGLKNEYGKPFSDSEQKAALKQAQKDNELYYKELKAKDEADIESNLAQQQADYQNYLLTSGQSFEQDKTALDQQAANQGVLFSGGRVQKEKNLQRGYEQDQASKLGTIGRNIADAARTYQNEWGDSSANKLSNYYSLGGNTYNPNVAQGGVSSGGLSSVYNPRDYNLQGRQVVDQKANANKRAAGILWNKGNKLLSSGYTNQY